MESTARTTLPDEAPNDVTCGIDWARDDHAVSIVDHRGREIVRSTVEHNAAGLRELLVVLERAGVREVAIERPDGPVVDTLLDIGVTVVVISPNQLKNLRGRYGSAGNKDDRFDAYVLADTLRTDRARLAPLLPDSPATVTLRQTCRARKDLVAHRVAVANQLRAHLKIVFPGAVGLFAELDSAISLAFLARFDCQDRADWLSAKRLAAWLASVGYSGRTDALRALPPAHRRTTWQRRRRRHRHHPRLHGRAVQPGRPDQGPRRRHRRTTRPPRRRAHLHLAAALGHVPRGPPAQRNRRLPSPFPHPGIAGLPGWRRPLHPPIRQSQARRIPLGGRQAAPRRGHRLRGRQQTRQPVGRRPLQPRHRPADTTTPMRSASSPEPGSTSSGTAGKTESPTTPPIIELSRPCSNTNDGRLDTGLLMSSPVGKSGPDPEGQVGATTAQQASGR